MKVERRWAGRIFWPEIKFAMFICASMLMSFIMGVLVGGTW